MDIVVPSLTSKSLRGLVGRDLGFVIRVFGGLAIAVFRLCFFAGLLDVVVIDSVTAYNCEE